jgi:PAS domain S-box-containing protein
MAENIPIESSSYESVLKQASQKRNIVFKFSKTYPAYIILLVFLVISYFVWNFFSIQVETDRRMSFDKAVNSVVTRFDTKYQTSLQVLTSIAGLYDNLVEVVRDYFYLYSTVPTQTNPSIVSLMYAPVIANNKQKKEEFEFNAQRQTKLAEYKIFPESSGDYFFPIYYIEPFKSNMYMAGFDLKSNKIANDAIIKARDNNSITATQIFEIRTTGKKSVVFEEAKYDTLKNPMGQIDFIDEKFIKKNVEFDIAKQEGFYIIAPVYIKDSARSTQSERTHNFNGVVILESNAEKYFKTALGSGLPSDTTIMFKIVEMSSDGKEKTVFESENSQNASKDFRPLISDAITIKIADRELKVMFSTVPGFGGGLQAQLPLISLIISLVISFVFFGFILSVSTSRARAMDLAERMTRSQRRIVETTDDIIAALDLNGVWKSMNPAAQVIFGYTPKEMIGKKIDNLFIDTTDSKKFYSVIKESNDEYTERLDLQMQTKSGDIKWLSWNLTVSINDGLIYSIGRDITLEKIAEENARLRAKQIELAEQFTKEASEFKSYFMTKLSHQMRNSLTGILGYLQLLYQKLYDDEEEQNSFISLAEESSEELFSFVEDMVDVAAETSIDISTLILDRIIGKTRTEVNKSLPETTKINISINEEGKNSTVVGDYKLLTHAFTHVFLALGEGVELTDIQITGMENTHEGATEIQVITSGNILVSDIIEVYKANKYNLIEALKNDKNDVLLRFAKAASLFRLMNGTMALETLGHEDGNVVQITLPINKPMS